MSTTFETATLITVAKAALVLHRLAVRDYEQAVARCKADHLAKWRKVNRPRLIIARDTLTKLLRSTRDPITRQSYRKAVGNDTEGIADLFYTEPGDYLIDREVGRPMWGYNLHADHWRGLIALLTARAEKEITDTQLARLGYPKLTVLFEAAARSGLDLS